MIEPLPVDPTWPRYSSDPFPAYRFVPGLSPHPRKDPHGHSYGRLDPAPAPFSPDLWHESAAYRYGIDLYNFAYWWESHEVFEGLWKGAGPSTEQGRFFQALVQLAAANLKCFMGNDRAAANLRNAAAERLRRVNSPYQGIDVTALVDRLLSCNPPEPILLRLLDEGRLNY